MTVEILDVEPPEEGGTPELEVFLRRAGAECVLVLRGALRAGSISVLEAELDRIGRDPCHRVVVDATELTDLDETGCRVLTGLGHYVRARGGTLAIIGAHTPVTSVPGAMTASDRAMNSNSE